VKDQLGEISSVRFSFPFSGDLVGITDSFYLDGNTAATNNMRLADGTSVTVVLCAHFFLYHVILTR
jgi:hypothetical protein